MAKFKEKISPFVFGVTVGLLIASSAFIFKLDEYIRNFQFREKSSFTSENPAEQELDVNEKQTEKSPSSKNLKSKRKLSNQKTQLPDSNSIVNFSTATIDENITVLKEELVGIKNIRIKTERDKLTTSKDSAIGKLAGIEEKSSGDFVIIEIGRAHV